MSLSYGPLSGHTVHLCIDTQNVVAEPTAWHTPWMARVLPAIEETAGSHAEQTVFTRFIPPARARDMPGTWERYLRHWEEMTLERIDTRLLELVPSLARLVPRRLSSTSSVLRLRRDGVVSGIADAPTGHAGDHQGGNRCLRLGGGAGGGRFWILSGAHDRCVVQLIGHDA
jgi:hypothetical protein